MDNYIICTWDSFSKTHKEVIRRSALEGGKVNVVILSDTVAYEVQGFYPAQSFNQRLSNLKQHTALVPLYVPDMNYLEWLLKSIAARGDRCAIVGTANKSLKAALRAMLKKHKITLRFSIGF